MIGDRPYLGILLMIGFCVVAPLGDGFAKLAGATIPLLMMVTVRFAVQAVALLPLIAARGQRLTMTRRVPRLTVWRTLFHIAGIGLMYASLYYLPLADAIAICFVMPFIMLLLGHFVLGEEVGPRRLAACTVGFVGTLMVIQPSFAEVGAAALLPLAVAVAFSLYMLVSRQVAKECDPMVLQVVSGLTGTPLLFGALLLTTSLPAPFFGIVMPTSWEWLLLAIIGGLGTVGHLLMTWSLRFAPAATVAPIQYLEIPVAAVLGLVLFAEFPNGLALAGIAVTIGSGLYILHRERSDARPLPSQA